MTTALATRPSFLVDRAGHPRFINRPAATAWLTGATDGRALQCPDCGDIHDHADDAFDCCDMQSACPVRSYAHDPQLTHNITTRELAERP